MLGASDDSQLRLAAGQGRVLFSQDEDFLALHRQGVSHAGIAYAPRQTSIGAVVRGLLLIYDVLAAEDMRRRVEFL